MQSSPGNEGRERPRHPQPDEAPPEATGPSNGGSVIAPAQADLAAELARAEDRYKRALADLDNYRKRSAREVDLRVADATERLLRDWLEALDSVERALRMETAESELAGLRAVLDQMESIMARQGAQRIGAAGERFDPERHEAIDVRVTDELPDQTIAEVTRSGFAVGDRVLRPAQVVVSRMPPTARADD